MVASRPSLRCNPRKKPVSCQGRRGFGHGVWSPTFVTIQWLWSQLCYMTAANQWAVGQIELLAKVGWKRNCQSFSCPCSLNVMHCRKEQEAPEKEICSTCLSQESILAIPFGISKHPLSTRSRFLRVTVRPTSSTILWLNHVHPFVAATEKNLSHAEKQKVWSRSCALQGLLCTIVSKIWIIYRILIVLLVMTCDCCKPMNSCRDWAFSNSGLEVGLPAFQLPMFSKCDALPKTDFCDCTVCLTSPWPLWNLSLRSLPQSQKLGPPPPWTPTP